jgi:hypothetical protein
LPIWIVTTPVAVPSMALMVWPWNTPDVSGDVGLDGDPLQATAVTHRLTTKLDLIGGSNGARLVTPPKHETVCRGGNGTLPI